MLRTSKQQSEGQSFHRQLLSEYNTDITLSNYVAYFELKAIAKEVEQLREAMEKRAAEIIKTNQDTHLRTFPSISAEGSVGSTPAKPAVMVFPRNNSISAFNMDPHSPLAQDCEDALRNDAALAEMSTKRQALHMRFFADLRASYKKVKMFLLTLEREMIVCVEQLRKQTEADIRNLDDAYIPSLYLKLQTILKYRHLNLLAFRKIMKKFLERCATDDLELQRRVVEIDDTINNSTVSRPTLDLRGIALQLVALYGTVYKYSYEEAIKHLRQYECRSGMNAQRLIPNSNTFFFTDAFPYQDPPGSFAIRVLAGSCSLFCEKMITELLQCQRTKAACCGRFANGEVSVQLPSPVRGDDVFILQSMVAQQHNQLSNAGSVMELALMTQAAHMSGAARITAVIPYLAYTRNTASIAAIAEVIESMGCHHVVTVDMHSDQVEGMFSIPMESISAQYEFVRFLCQQLKAEGDGCTALTVVATSGNFLGRAKDFADAMMGVGELDPSTQFVSVCTAVKRVPPTLPVRSQSPATIAARAAGLRHLASSSATGTPVVADLNDVAAMDSPAVLGAFATAGEVDMLFGEEEEEELPDDDNEFSINYSTMVNANTIADAPAEELRMMSQLGQESPLIAVRETSSTPFGAWSSSHGGTPAQRNVGRFPRHLTDGTNSDDATTPSTFGMEKALRRQEKGRRAILTERVDTKTIENIALVGEVRGRVCIILDTVIDEAIHICQVARSLEAHGASRIILCATHAVMSGQAPARLVDAPIDLIVVTDSINQDEFMKQPKLARKMRVVPIAPLLSRSIEKIHTESTLRTLFDKN